MPQGIKGKPAVNTLGLSASWEYWLVDDIGRKGRTCVSTYKPSLSRKYLLIGLYGK